MLSDGTLEESAEAGRTAPVTSRRATLAAVLSVLALVAALLLFAAAGAYQLQLPGLHYDEAKEAGLNAMQLLTGQPVTAFRDATVGIGSWRVPLMVQDYIGNLNVLLAIPFLAIGGVDTIALRALPLAIAALTLFLTWKVAGRLGGPWAAGAAALLLAVNPSFVFWSRQGIFVTNSTALFLMASLWFGIVWWEQRRGVHLVLAALCCGLGVYAKLLFVWAAVALAVVGGCALLLERRRPARERRSLPSLSTLVLAGLAFLLPLTPLILFNVRTGGTFTSIFGNLGRSYYGVDNSAYGSNLMARLGQLLSVFRGDHFWYLGEVRANAFASGLLLALLLLAGAAWLSVRRSTHDANVAGRHPFTPGLPLALLALIALQSAFTVSDLFITHFALVTPLISLTAGLALSEVARWAQARRAPGRGAAAPHMPPSRATSAASWAAAAMALLLVAGWAVSDSYSVVHYHRALAITGGYSTHSDAIYDLAEYLDKEGYTSPVALDWGIDAPVRFLTQGRVQAVDVFGYDRLDLPDAGFMSRMKPYLEDWKTIYLIHSPDKTVFRGRVEAIEGEAVAIGFRWLEQIRFGQRSGEPVFMVYRFQH